MADLHCETGKHQDQVKVLIEKTASSLDDTALKMLFVSVQQNNIDLCVQYAINSYAVFLIICEIWQTLTFFSMTEIIGQYPTVCPHHPNPNDLHKAEFNSENYDNVCSVMVWAFICE